MNNIVAILVDGGFYQRRAIQLWNDLNAQDRAKELEKYCRFHLDNTDKLYRIFYYDCKPLDINVYHPLLRKDKNLKTTTLYDYMNTFHKELMTKRKIALRWGRLSNNDTRYILTNDATKAIVSGKISVDELKEKDFVLDVKQKGVDMCIGLDISSLAYKRLVNQIILISGDSDFVPAAKLARREGVDFMLDPMGASINVDLQEHIDGIKSPLYKDDFGKYISPLSSKSKKQYRNKRHIN